MNKQTEHSGCNCPVGIEALLKRQDLMLRIILMDTATLGAKLDAANAKTTKIIGEIKGLKDAFANASTTVSPEIEAKANQLFSNLDIADELNADVEPEPVAEVEAEPEPEPVTDPVDVAAAEAESNPN